MSEIVETISSDISMDIVEKTIPDLVLENVREDPDGIAIRFKEDGVWNELTWEEHYRKIRRFALGLEELGFGEEDTLLTMAFNRPQHLWAWLSAAWLGGKSAPQHQDAQSDQVFEQLELVRPSIVYAEDQQVVDKILDSIADSPYIDTVIYYDEKGMFRYDPESIDLLSIDDVFELGREREGDISDEGFRTRTDDLNSDVPVLLSPTSGTTGTPKRVILTHANFINLGKSWLSVDALPPGSDYFSSAPLAWIGDQLVLLSVCLLGRWTANFPEEPETKQTDLREIGPEMYYSSPTAYEQYIADIKAKIENTTRFKKFIYDLTMNIGHKYASYISGENSNEEPSLSLRVQHWLSYWVMYRPILDKLGLKRVKYMYTGGGMLGEEHFQYFHALGIPLKQIWGQTEVCGFVTVHPDNDIQADTVGTVVPNVEAGITDEQELTVRGPVVTDGYYRQPDKTEESIRDGWLYTDDYGSITDEGHVKIHDRMDNVIMLADGTEVHPAKIESKLKFNPYIEEAMVIGEGRKFLSAIVNIRYDNVAEWADQRDIQYSGYRDLSQHPQVLKLIESLVQETNKEFDEEMQIRCFVSLFKQFDADDGEVTRTGKLRRAIILDRYESLIAAIYTGEDTIEVESEITYQDGSTSVQKAEIQIQDVGK